MKPKDPTFARSGRTWGTQPPFKSSIVSPVNPGPPAREVLPRQFWQRRFHDFNVWSHTKKLEKLEYMHFNPVKRKLVRDPKD